MEKISELSEEVDQIQGRFLGGRFMLKSPFQSGRVRTSIQLDHGLVGIATVKIRDQGRGQPELAIDPLNVLTIFFPKDFYHGFVIENAGFCVWGLTDNII